MTVSIPSPANRSASVPPVLCIGKFDALHLGHRALVERAATAARGGPVALLSFTGMAEVLGWDRRLPLVAEADRARVLADWGRELGTSSPCTSVQEVLMPFAAIRDLDAAGFLAEVHRSIGSTVLVVGEDFRGGRGRLTDAAGFAAEAQRLGMSVVVVPARLVEGQPASSSRARQALESGAVAHAATILGRSHRLLGTVQRGDGRGRTIGVPTANLGARQNLEPGGGVYAAWAVLGASADHAGRRIPAAVNIGRLPTVAPDRPLTVEAHLIGWQGDLYDQPLALDFVQRIRDEARFPSLDALVTRIHQDVAEAGRILGC